MNKINWSKYFDAIWCIDYKPHTLRKQLIIEQLDRIGILSHPNFKFHETFSSPYDEYLYNNLKKDNKISVASVGVMNAAFGHYSCIKKSLLDNYKRILIIQNDARFLKKLQQIEDILNNIPQDADIILFDYFICCSSNQFQQYKQQCINSYYYHYKNLSSVGCYMLSYKAMNIISKYYQEFLYPPDIYISQDKFKNDLKKYFTLKNMSCQATFSDCLNVSVTDINILHLTYYKSKLNYNDYNMNNGQQYNFGDYIQE